MEENILITNPKVLELLKDYEIAQAAIKANDCPGLKSLLASSKYSAYLLNSHFKHIRSPHNYMVMFAVYYNRLDCLKAITTHPQFDQKSIDFPRGDAPALRHALRHHYCDMINWFLGEDHIPLSTLYNIIRSYAFRRHQDLKLLLNCKDINILLYKLHQWKLHPTKSLVVMYSHSGLNISGVICASSQESFEMLFEHTLDTIGNRSFQTVFSFLRVCSLLTLRVQHQYIFQTFFSENNSKYPLIQKAHNWAGEVATNDNNSYIYKLCLVLHDDFDKEEFKFLDHLFKALMLPLPCIIYTILVSKNHNYLQFFCDLLESLNLKFSPHIPYLYFEFKRWIKTEFDSEQLEMAKKLFTFLTQLNYPFDAHLAHLLDVINKDIPIQSTLIYMIIPFAYEFQPSNVSKLEDLTRLQIRKTIFENNGRTCKGLIDGIMALPYPVSIKNYLRFNLCYSNFK